MFKRPLAYCAQWFDIIIRLVVLRVGIYRCVQSFGGCDTSEYGGMQLLGSRVSSQQFKGFAQFDNVVCQIVVSSYYSDGFA